MPYVTQNARSFSPTVRFFAARPSPGAFPQAGFEPRLSSSPLAAVGSGDHARGVTSVPVSPDLPILQPGVVQSLRALAAATAHPGEDILGDLVGLFSRDAAARLHIIRERWQRGEAQEAANCAHALKGAAASLGAARVHALAAAVERAAKAASDFEEALVDELAREVAAAEASLRADLAVPRPNPTR